MKLGFRYYGNKDKIPLQYIAEIPSVETIVSALYDKKPGEKWDEDSLLALKEKANKAGLAFEVVESIPVSEEIKLGGPLRDAHIDAFLHNLELCGKVGVKVVCYNFMPVFDWLRTDMDYKNEDGSVSLAYIAEHFKTVDPHNLHLPGWDESYSQEELEALLKAYEKVGHKELFENLVYLLKKAMPICDKYNISLAIHPDDPPWDVFGLPRIVSNEKDIDALLAAVDNVHNGLTLCTGSLGAGRCNDIPYLADKYSKMGRIHFVHLRNITFLGDDGSFKESGHQKGDLDLPLVVENLVKNGFDGYVRPDHGRGVFGELPSGGYGLYDRALGASYIAGLFAMAERK